MEKSLLNLAYLRIVVMRVGSHAACRVLDVTCILLCRSIGTRASGGHFLPWFAH